jgi:DNA-directed RNA polymerase subunit RPC12/RpoP
MDKIVLDCSKCGGVLEITQDIEIFKCQYCGTPYMVERSEGTVRIIKLEQRVEKIEAEQSKIRVEVMEKEFLQIIDEIEQVRLDEKHYLKNSNRLFDNITDFAQGINKLYQKAFELKQEYTQRGGSNSLILVSSILLKSLTT